MQQYRRANSVLRYHWEVHDDIVGRDHTIRALQKMQTVNIQHCPPAEKHLDSCFSEEAGDIYGGGGDSEKGKSGWSTINIQANLLTT